MKKNLKTFTNTRTPFKNFVESIYIKLYYNIIYNQYQFVEKYLSCININLHN